MTEAEKQLLEDLYPRLQNWWRVYHDRQQRNISIQYLVEVVLREYKVKTDFSQDYSGPTDRTITAAPDVKDADFLCMCWRELATPGTENLTVGTHGMKVKQAKAIVMLHVFGPPFAVKKAARNIWRIKEAKARQWTDDALIFFALRVQFMEKVLRRKNLTFSD